MPVAFHRAFDMCNDLGNALETLIALGFVRVLTSGAAENALTGTKVISNLIAQAKGRIQVMPGAGINPSNISKIKTLTGAETFHSSARETVMSKMTYRNQSAKMGTVTDEYQYEQTSTAIVKNLVLNLNQL